MKKNVLNVLYPLTTLVLLLLAWFAAAKIVDVKLIVPSVAETFHSLSVLLSQRAFYQAVGGTLFRTLISFSVSFVLAIILAAVSAFLPSVSKLLSPFVTVMRSVPTMTVILMTVVWLKPSQSPVLVAALMVFPIMYGNFHTAISSVERDLVEMSRAYGVNKKDTVFRLYLPNIAPGFFDAVKNSLSMNVKIIISAEVLAQTRRSMGLMMQIAKSKLETAELLAWALTAIALSFLLEFAVTALKKLTVRWQP